MHDCDKNYNLNLSLRSSLFEDSTESTTTTTHSIEDETSQTKHDIFLLKQIIKMQNDMMNEYEKSIENLNKNSPRSSAESINSECYLELEKKIEQLRNENNRLVLECQKNNNLLVEDIENEKIYVSKNVYEDLIIERKHLKSQYDVYKELFESSEAHVFKLEDMIENLKEENKELLSEIGKLNFGIEKLKEENDTCRIEFDDLIQKLTKKKEEEANYYEIKIQQLVEDKKQAFNDIESLTTTIELMKRNINNKCPVDRMNNNINYFETLNGMSKLIEDLEEKFFSVINLINIYENYSQSFEKQTFLCKENEKIFHETISSTKHLLPSNINVKSLCEEINEIKCKEIYNYNVLSSSQQLTLVESFICLAICLLIYEFYLLIISFF
ncbi:Hypothetical protein SRAE_2000427500 [Strongyloides ratti]|uniref:Uncharacterized protein n=1 Tax=Strongyloides ratti TaxID=34506 RepID=A0A090LIQ8_STRRB|nr:Hypothetical protein SRAE_2000427500 [Strongyloides ratti]CEF69628.1 Hypothetical protein SRAE_2000427500 [Strongyloides ratti]